MTAEQILDPYYKQNNGGLEEWIDYEDACNVLIEFAKIKVKEVLEEIQKKELLNVTSWYTNFNTNEYKYFDDEGDEFNITVNRDAFDYNLENIK